VPDFQPIVDEFSRLLQREGFSLQATNVRVSFNRPVVDTPIFAIPDVHLCDGSNGDIFLSGNPAKAKKLAATLQAIHDYREIHPHSARAVQLGDWFDIWRVCGNDPMTMKFGAIENAAAFERILDLDAQIGLPHIIGNHDAGFLNAVPNRRANQPNFFRSGFWLGNNVYALHGHQTSVVPPAGASFDELAVHVATVLGRFVPGVTAIEQFIDGQQIVEGIKKWLKEIFTGKHEDTGPHLRPRDEGTLPALIQAGNFVVREDLDALISIVHKVEQMPESQGRAADLVLVGHSHVPCVSWSNLGPRPVVLVDTGSWVYDQSDFVIAAGDTVAVFKVA
jgi:hypothetical protein